MDAAEMILSDDRKMCLFMEAGSSWTTPSGVRFTKEHPYQLVDWWEGADLLRNEERKFRVAEKDEVKQFYLA